MNDRFIARCEQIAIGEGGERLSSPEPSRTPEYYRGDSFPVWVRLSKITKVKDEEWNRRLGAVPQGEQTMFAVPLDAPDLARQRLQDEFDVQRIEIGPSSILHISDLHFGSDYGFPLASRKVPTPRSTLDEVIAEGLDKVSPEGVGLLVVSGDITTRGQLEGFTAARQFLKALTERIGLTREQVVLVPGNHDILLEDSKATRNYSAEVPFREFLQLMYNEENLDLNRIYWFTSREDQRDILVIALNSVRPREAETMEYGYVGRDLYKPLIERASGLRKAIVAQSKNAPLVLAVLHHHVLPTPLIEEPDAKRPVSLTLDAGQLIEDLQLAGCDAVLHGHQHVPFVGSTSRSHRLQSGGWRMGRPVHVIGGGSCGVKMDRLWDNMRNNALGLYKPIGRRLNVRMFEFAPTVDLREYLSLDLKLA